MPIAPVGFPPAERSSFFAQVQDHRRQVFTGSVCTQCVAVANLHLVFIRIILPDLIQDFVKDGTALVILEPQFKAFQRGVIGRRIKQAYPTHQRIIVSLYNRSSVSRKEKSYRYLTSIARMSLLVAW